MRHFQLTCTRHGIKKQQLLICCVLIPPAPSLFFLAAKRKRKGKKTEQGTTSRPVDLNLETVETNNKNTTTTSKEEDGPNTRMSISLCGWRSVCALVLVGRVTRPSSARENNKKRQRMWNCEGDWPQHWTHTNKNVLHVLIEFPCGFAPSLLRKAFDGQRASIEKKTWNLRKRSVPQSKIYNLIVGAGSSPTCLYLGYCYIPSKRGKCDG